VIGGGFLVREYLQLSFFLFPSRGDITGLKTVENVCWAGNVSEPKCTGAARGCEANSPPLCRRHRPDEGSIPCPVTWPFVDLSPLSQSARGGSSHG
jgi:hypothetical protein